MPATNRVRDAEERPTPRKLVLLAAAVLAALAVPPPRKDAAWYEACHGFGAWLLAEYGMGAVRGFLGNGLGGTWETLDDLVRPFGTDFPGHLDRWSGGKGLPPYRRDS